MKRTLINSVAIITIFSVITRALGLILKVYISREISAEALGIYQVSLSVFSMLCVLVSSGLPFIVSKQVANSKENNGGIVFGGTIISLIICFLICLIIFIFPNFFTLIFGQKESTKALFYLVPGIIGTSLYAAFRGAFWGKRDFFTLGLVELVEQVVRIAICLIMFNITFLSLEGENIASLSLSLACVISSLMAVAIFFFKKNKFGPKKGIVGPILKQSTPITIARSLSSVVGLSMALVIPASLVSRSGLTLSQSLAQFGVLTGMAMPLITIAGTLIAAISSALIPEIADSKNQRSGHQTNTAISASIIIACFCFSIFFAMGKQIGSWLFSNNLAGNLLLYGSILILPLSLSQITTSIMNATGHETKSLFIYLFGSVVLFACLIFLPKYVGIYSVVIGLGSHALIDCALNSLVLKKQLSVLPFKTLIICLPLCFPSIMLAKWSYNLLVLFLPNFFAIILGCFVCGISYLSLIIAFDALNIKTFFARRKLKHV